MSLGKLFFGIVVLLVGIMFLLDTLDIVPGAWRLWPVIVIVAAIFIIVATLIRPRTPWYKTEEGWKNFAEKMERKFGDQKKWEKFGEKMEKKFGDEKKWEKCGAKMEKMGEEFEKEFEDDKSNH
ncbi:LiaI-LiaF-like domain-containing protein [Patescibacteria group bacterium]